MDTSQLKMAAWGLTFPPPSGQLSHTVAGLEGARLQAFGLDDERGDISRLMIFLPPRHGKSLITSSLFPAWYLGRHPDHHVIFATYGQELSDDFGRRVRNSIVDQVHQAVFPNCRLSEDSSAAHRFNTTQGGAYYAVGRGGPITGRGALIAD